MIVDDWRNVDPADLAPVYARERATWLNQLRWDPASAWETVEIARTTWGLPGFVARDAHGGICGTLFYLREGTRIDIGGITADTPETTAALLDAVISDATAVEDVRCFCFASAPSLQPELTRRGFTVEPFSYLLRTITPDDDNGSRTEDTMAPDRSLHHLTVGDWQTDDVESAAALLHRAYAPGDGDVFAPGHDPLEWERYLRNLVEQTTCGVVDASASRMVRAGGRVVAFALVTTISQGTAHLAQLAVEPELRRKGLAAALVREVCVRAAAHAHTAMTLLVSARASAARRLYAANGFSEAAMFVAGSGYPRRFTSAACAGAGAMTRR